MKHPARSLIPSLAMVLLASTLLTACSDRAEAPLAPRAATRAADVAPDTGMRVPRGNGGVVANPRAKLQDELRARGDFAETCASLPYVSSRLAALAGCAGADRWATRRSIGDDEVTPEMEEMLAEADALGAELDLAWNQAPYLVEQPSGGLQQTMPAACGPLLFAALGATGKAVFDIGRVGFGFRFRLPNVMRDGINGARDSVPAAITAIGAFVYCERILEEGGNDRDRRYR